MPSRQIPPPPAELLSPQPILHHHHRPRHSLIILTVVAGTLAVSIIIFLAVLYRKLSRKRTAPADLKPPHRFSYSLLRRATSSFSTSNRLGQGGFGSVYRATLPSGQEVAVKLMDSGSLQGEREFQNELSLATKIDSNYVVPLLGFSTDRRRRKLMLVYELMFNGSLQDALLDRKCPELMEWKKRFGVATDVANGLLYLHNSCVPPIIHGDIKPSNILLDCYFAAKIADFGLARIRSDDDQEDGIVEIEGANRGKRKEGILDEDNGSILEETESVITGFDDGIGNVEASPVVVAEVSPEEGMDKSSLSEGYFDKLSVDSGKGRRVGRRKKSGSGRDWWWKQDNGGGGSESGRVKDYVMEWIGTEIKKERPKSEWVASPSSVESSTPTPTPTPTPIPSAKIDEKKHRKRLEWWASLDEERVRKKEKNRRPREWWKEEFCEELTKKKKKKKKKRGGKSSSNGGNGGELWWQRDEELVPERKKRKKSSKSSIDWWLDGLSGGEISRNGRRNSQDWANGDIPKSGGISSTPSMRGTVCYIAPEYGGGGQLSEMCDVYSFGVLLLVLISGRRPLQVTASPMSEFERANLISWARQLAYNGKLLDLVDTSIESLDREQALLCITIALLCLQRSPGNRPTMKEIVGMLSGDTEPPPHLPFEFSPSPPSNFHFKSKKKAR